MYIHISHNTCMETIHNNKIALCTVKAGFKIYRVQPYFFFLLKRIILKQFHIVNVVFGLPLKRYY